MAEFLRLRFKLVPLYMDPLITPFNVLYYAYREDSPSFPRGLFVFRLFELLCCCFFISYIETATSRDANIHCHAAARRILLFLIPRARPSYSLENYQQ